MSRSLARWLALLVAAHAMLTAGSASARGRRHIGFRVDVRTGGVESLAQAPPLPPERSWPEPASDKRRTTCDKGTVQVFPGDPTADKPIWQFAIPGAGDGWSPWQVVQGNTVAFVWRDAMPGRRYEARDTARAVDMTSGKVIGEYQLGRHDMFFDQSTVVAIEARDGWVDVAAEFILLD